MTLWDITDPEQPQRVGEPITRGGPIVNLAFTPDARILAIASDYTTSTATLLDITDREHPSALGPPLNLDKASVSDLSFSSDGRILAVTADNAVRLWDVAKPDRPRPLGQQLAQPNAPPDELVPMLFGRFSSDARTLVVTTNTAILWDITEPDNPRELGQTGAYDTESISVVSIAPDGRTLATVASRGVELWDITNPEQPSPMTMLTALPNGQVEELAFAPDGRSLAVAVGDLVTLWELGPNGPQPRGKPLSGHTSSVTSMAFTPDSRTLITTSRDKTAILWNLAASDLAPPVSQPFDAIRVAFSPDPHIMATVEPDNSVLLWDIADPAQPVVSANSSRATATTSRTWPFRGMDRP